MKVQTNIITLLFLSFSFFSYAQSYIGGKANLQTSNITLEGLGTNSLIDINTMSTYTVGMVYQTDLGDQFFFRPELIFSRKGFDSKVDTEIDVYGDFSLPVGVGMKTEFNYIETPINLGYSIDLGKAKLQLYGGPTFAYATSAIIKPYATAILNFNLRKQEIDLGNDKYNRFEVGGNLGMNFAFPLASGDILLDARYNKSFTNFLDNPIVDLKITHQSYSFGIGYIHRLKV